MECMRRIVASSQRARDETSRTSSQQHYQEWLGPAGSQDVAVVVAYLIVDQGGQRQAIEQVCEDFPHTRTAILPQALIVEAINLSDLPRLVVPAKDCNPAWVPNLHRDQEGDSFD